VSTNYTPKAERGRVIKEAIGESDNMGQFTFQRQIYDEPIIELDEQYLIYRANNTRLLGDEEIYCAKNNEDPDAFFSLDREENKKVQDLLHDFLKKYRGKLAKTYKQEGVLDPLIIFPNGRVINGNRRLCFYRDTGIDKIRCIVLTNTYLTNKELEIESELDIREIDEKKYEWYNVGSNLYKLKQKEGGNVQKVSQQRALPASAIEVKITAYLGAKKWLELVGTPGRWDLLGSSPKSKQIWMDYAKAFKSNSRNVSDEERDMGLAWTGIVATVPANHMGERKYAYHRPLVTNKDHLKTIMTKVFPESKVEAGDFGTLEAFDLTAAVKTLKEDPGEIIKKYDAIRQEQDKIADQKSEGKRKNIVKQDLAEAKSHVAKSLANLKKYDDLNLGGISDVLLEIEENIKNIKKFLK
tara:strand:+ start:2335 stop:3567 length:1233 start_codon:yes stop_codon:yes gene_type:complete